MKNDKIVALDDRQKAREKLPVFYGSRDNFTHGFREVLNNGIDEVLNNFKIGTIEVELFDDLETISIKDSGRGIPIQEVDDNGKPYYDLIFTTLFAGGKYEASDNSNSGVNGVGLSTLVFSSEMFNSEIANGGFIYKIEYKDGGYIKTPLTKLGKTNEHYTKLTFKLDKEVYTSTTYSYEYIKDIVDKTAKVSPNITISLKYKDSIEEFNYSSLLDYFNTHTNDNFTDPYLGDNKLYEELDGEKTQIQVVFASTNSDENKLQECMLNGNNLIEKSSIYEGIINGFKLVTHKYAKENGLYLKNEKNIVSDDIDSSINFCCNVLSNRIEFANQTKFSTLKKLYKEISQKYIQELLEIYSVENKDEFLKLISNVLISKRIREKSEVNRSKLKKEFEEKVTNASNRPEKFIPCRSKIAEEIELILIEGESAKNCIETSRNKYNMCIYPLKGKPLNVLKAKSIDAILDNQEIKDILKILGCGVNYKGKNIKGVPHFNIENMNVGKILITTDMDVDGCHIQSLLLGLFYALAPELIKQGKIYLLHTPLYVITTKTEELYAYTEEERNSIIKNLTVKFKEVRYKGLGGISPQTMSKTAMDINNRRLEQVIWGDLEGGKNMINLCLTDEMSEERSKYIDDNGSNFFDYSLLEVN